MTSENALVTLLEAVFNIFLRTHTHTQTHTQTWRPCCSMRARGN